jgi:hypothetical protein
MVNIPVLPIFKYGAVISTPLFGLTVLLLLRTVGNFSFTRQTISQTVMFADKPWQRMVFKLNFLVKSILDLLFIYYTLKKLEIPLSSAVGIIWIESIICFGMITVFPVDTHKLKHYIVTYLSGTLFSAGQMAVAWYINNPQFLQFTLASVILNLSLAYGFLLFRKTTVVVQSICIMLMYIWTIVLVYGFL